MSHPNRVVYGSISPPNSMLNQCQLSRPLRYYTGDVFQATEKGARGHVQAAQRLLQLPK
jgi:hypothetical protein